MLKNLSISNFMESHVTVRGSTVTFHYYTQDYLGNNRAVINGSTGAIEQTVAYYPFGAVIADLGTPATGQPYKFGGKELLTTNGLNEYDFGARNYYSAVPSFTKLDPHCENYYWLSPYLYCSNNPVNSIDPTGKDSWTLDSNGYLMNYIQTDKYDEIIIVNKKNDDEHIWKGNYGSIKQLEDSNVEYVITTNFSAVNDEIGLDAFVFIADNSTVEWSLLQVGLNVDNIENIVTTSHEKKAEAGATAYLIDHLFEFDTRNAIHSHPSRIAYPSGLDWDPMNPGDVQFARWLDGINKNTQAIYMIYNPQNRTFIKFDGGSTNFDFPH